MGGLRVRAGRVAYDRACCFAGAGQALRPAGGVAGSVPPLVGDRTDANSRRRRGGCTRCACTERGAQMFGVRGGRPDERADWARARGLRRRRGEAVKPTVSFLSLHAESGGRFGQTCCLGLALAAMGLHESWRARAAAATSVQDTCFCWGGADGQVCMTRDA